MNANFFKNNRLKLAEAVSGGLVVLTAYSRMQRGNDMASAFEQEANFWYCTGIEEADWMLIIDGTRHMSWLVKPEVDDVHKIFDGELSIEQAKELSGVDDVVSFDEGISLLRRLAKTHSLAHTITQPEHVSYFNFTLNPAIAQNNARLERIFARVQSCNKELAKLRAIKQPQEIKCIEKAIAITIDAFNNVRENMPAYTHEYEIEAEMTKVIRASGAHGHAYDPIVAGGMNACTLHYNQNSARIKPRQFVLMDVGARYGGYAADISRTYSKGEPNQRQKLLHELLQEAHATIISVLKPGLSVVEYQQRVDAVMYDVLQRAGFSGDKESLVRQYMPHAVSHGLGIDVHESLGKAKTFEEGMLLTVEPGVYIPQEKIGIRIEDNILITASGHKNLSAKLPIAY